MKFLWSLLLLECAVSSTLTQLTKPQIYSTENTNFNQNIFPLRATRSLLQSSATSPDNRAFKAHPTHIFDELDQLGGLVLPHGRLGVDSFDLKSIIEVQRYEFPHKKFNQKFPNHECAGIQARDLALQERNNRVEKAMRDMVRIPHKSP
jgi:hypothetical protein